MSPKRNHNQHPARRDALLLLLVLVAAAPLALARPQAGISADSTLLTSRTVQPTALPVISNDEQHQPGPHELNEGRAGRPEARILRGNLREPDPTPWGPAGAVILCLLPIVFLVLVTVVKQVLLPTNISLPAAALMLAFIRLAYLSSPTVLVSACMVAGMLEALTPLSIIAGAIMLFQTMHHTKCLPWMMGQIKSLSAGHPVGEVFLIGFAFAYLVEGASGFGTPVALAAPMLASLGHAPIPTVVCLLIMNTLATQFGAVGTPIWFGFGDLGLGEANLLLVGFKASILVGASAYIIAPWAASFLVPWKELIRSGLFVVLSISTAVAPALLISLFSYEFPSLIGGLASVLLTGVLVKFKIGLRPIDPALAEAQQSAAAAASAAVAAENDMHRGSQAHNLRHTLTSKGGSTIYASSTVSQRTLSTNKSFSFVEGVGVVTHPPVATLDFPLTNAPARYTRARVHSFAAQADEATIAAELAALKHSWHEDHHAVSRNSAGVAEETSAAACEDVESMEEGTLATKDAAVGSNAHGSKPYLHHLESVVKERDSSTPAQGTVPLPVAVQAKDPEAAQSKKDQQGPALQGKDLMVAPAAEHPAKPALRNSPSGHMQLDPLDPEVAVKPRLTVKDLVLRTLPLWMTVLLLLLTRIPALPIKRTLQSINPSFYWNLGNLGSFGISASLVVQLRRVLSEPMVNWKYELLYVPFLLPFALASLITVVVHRKDLEVKWTTPFKEAFQRVGGIAIATLGALVLVQLIRVGGAGSPAFIIGYYFSSWLAQGFLAISAFLGALGSFFSGSTTVSNLTFGDIQSIAAERIRLSVTSMLAVQVAGATIGNMICINNILSAKAVMNMNHVGEGEFIRRTAVVALVFCLMVQAIGLIFTIGGVMPDKPFPVIM